MTIINPVSSAGLTLAETAKVAALVAAGLDRPTAIAQVRGTDANPSPSPMMPLRASESQAPAHFTLHDTPEVRERRGELNAWSREQAVATGRAIRERQR